MALGSERSGYPAAWHRAPRSQKRRPGRPYPPEPQVWFDGLFFKENELPRDFPSWRTACRGGVCTELHALHTQPRFFSSYYAWLMEAAKIALLPAIANVSERAVYEACVSVLNKNMHFNDALLRLTIFPTPTHRGPGIEVLTSSLLLEDRSLRQTGFRPRSQGLLMRVLEDGTKPLNERSNVRWLGDPIEWISERLLQESMWSEHLLLNSAGRVANAVGGMVYCVVDDEIATPPLSEGVCYDPIREWVDAACVATTGKSPIKRPLSLKEVEAAREVFIASSANGIESVVGVDNSRYRISLSNEICEKLNRIYFPELYL